MGPMSTAPRPETLPTLFLEAVKKYDKPDAFQYKKDGKYTNVSHREMLAAVKEGALGLLSLNLVSGDRVALLSENRIEWPMADLSMLCAGCINVPAYATLPAGHIEYILRDCEARAVFVSTPEQLAKIDAIRGNLPSLQHIISFEPTTMDGVMTLADLREHGRQYPNPDEFDKRVAGISATDWATIIYTSGTTGDPKGTILTHKNIMSNVDVLSEIFKDDITVADTGLSLLPLSHVFERTGGYYTIIALGATIAFAESIDTVPQNLNEVRPTFMLSVPRLYEKMHGRIMEAVSAGSGLKQGLFNWALGVGKQYVKEKLGNRLSGGTKFKYGLADKLVFKKLRGRTGGRLKFFISGGAPLSRDLAEFFYAAGLPILEGYGLTETSPVIGVNSFAALKFGTVGKPVANIEVKIADDGEIVVKGPGIMLGYYKKPEQTAEVLQDGWFHTGDIGHVDDEGFLHITDRKKDIIVTAGGKNVAPQPIENLFKTSKYIAEAVCIGNRRKYISALIVPDFDALAPFVAAAGIATTDPAALVLDEKVRKKIEDEIDRVSEHLAGYERIKRFGLLANPFTIEANELTPTMKVKRRVIEEKYKEQIDAMYAE